MAALRIVYFELAVGKHGAGSDGDLLGFADGGAWINGYAATTAGGATENAAQREIGTGIAVAQHLPAAAAMQHLGITLAGYGVGIHPADAAIAPLLLQTGAQFVGKVVAGGMGVAQLDDTEFHVAASVEPLQLVEPHRLPAAVVSKLGFFRRALGGGFGAAGLAGEQAGGHQGQLAAFFGKQHYSSYPSIMIFHSPSRFRRRQGWLAQRHWQVGSRYGLLSGRPETVVPLW